MKYVNRAFSYIRLQALLLFVLTLLSFHSVALPDQDYQFFIACFGQPATGECAKTDFNQDGVTNLNDFTLLLQVYRYDLNGDGVVDISSTASGTDLNLFQACFGQAAVGVCTKADFDANGVVNATDDVLLHTAVSSFDFNGDLRAEYYRDYPPAFNNIRAQTLYEGQLLSFYIWATDLNNERVSYTLDRLPGSARAVPVLFGDFNNDARVDDKDSALLRQAIRQSQATAEHRDNDKPVPQKRQRHFAQFDLNNDRVLDDLDVQLLDTLRDRQEQALQLNWTPGPTDSGFYDLTAHATSHNLDGVPVTTSQNFKVTVLDRQATDNYYGYDDVLLIVNRNSEDSQAIGDYFRHQRNLTRQQVVYLRTSTEETIDWDTFYNEIVMPVQQHIRSNHLQRQIRYLVTTKGVPLRILQANYTFGTVTDTLRRAVDSQLTQLDDPLPRTPGATPNPYFQSPYPFSREMYGTYLVTRLTGYSVADVRRLIDNAANAAPNGSFILDIAPARDIPGYQPGNDWMREAHIILSTGGWDSFLEQTDTYLTGQVNVLGYVSWGSNDAHARNHAIPNHTWAPGALAETFVSTSARSFSTPPSYGQSLIADLIAEGVTGVKGYVFEPFLTAMARPHILFPRYTSGFTLADSYYAASRFIGWMDVVVGDPKAAIVRSMCKSPSLRDAHCRENCGRHHQRAHDDDHGNCEQQPHRKHPDAHENDDPHDTETERLRQPYGALADQHSERVHKPHKDRKARKWYRRD